MKNVPNSIFALVLCVLVVSSGFAQYTASIKSTEPMIDITDYTRYTNLAEILESKGLEVAGVGDNINVRIKEIRSISLNTQPLFVLDNVSLGINYNLVNNALSPEIISSVRIIKDTSELAMWGAQGINGVIMIETKTHNQTKAIN